tara:strand:- start:88340 stop:88534 length:195 start_codon:yes stop_codon:yes gene_type:complete
MNKTYKAITTTIVDALNEVEDFTIKMDNFIKRNPEFEYKIFITKNDKSIYTIELNVIRNEPKYN